MCLGEVRGSWSFKEVRRTRSLSTVVIGVGVMCEGLGSGQGMWLCALRWLSGVMVLGCVGVLECRGT